MTHVNDKPSLNTSRCKYGYLMARSGTFNNMAPESLLLSRRIHMQTKYFITALYKWRAGFFCCMIRAGSTPWHRNPTSPTRTSRQTRITGMTRHAGIAAETRLCYFTERRHTSCADWSICGIWGSYDDNVTWLRAAGLIITNVSE
jgi:hypothetical protein